MKKLIPIVVFFILQLPHTLFSQNILEDKVYEDNIRSARIYPKTAELSSQMNSPVIALNSPFPLVLEFDDLAYDPDMYSAKLIHCNADWTQSGLRDPDYMGQFNEFNVNQYDYSINTRIPYIHFNFEVPRVSRSGNYILKVYRGRNEQEVILTKRFMVYDNQLNVGASVVPPSRTEDRRGSQQININVNYGSRELLDPVNNVKIVIRQNQRWDNIIDGLKPTSVREDRRMLEYQRFDGTNTFVAGNEFRFVDLRYVRAKGRNIASVEMEEDVVFAEAGIDNSRSGQSYLEYLDLNGQYGILNVERQNHALESEYVLLTFNFKSGKLDKEPVILGALTNWGTDPDAKMEYDDQKGMYQATLFLKQGWYDYLYGFPSDRGWEMESIEGTHFQTENEYEVLVYYREMGSRYDELIGYTVVNPNKRRI